MGKAAKQQRAAAAAAAAASSSSKSSSSSWTLYGLVAVAVAIAVQAFLLYGSPSTTTTEPEPPPPLPAAVCPPNWPECPRIPGADWVALAALEQEASSAPSREALEAYCRPSELLSQQEVRGMHLFCVLPPDETADGGNATRLVVFSDMNDGPAGPPPSVVALPAGLRTAADAIAALRHTLRLPPRQPAAARRQPAALFSDRGVRIETAAGLLSQRRALLLEGGQWLWPPVHIGHAHVLPDLVAKGVETRVVTKSMKPLVVEIEARRATRCHRACRRPPRTPPPAATNRHRAADRHRPSRAELFDVSGGRPHHHAGEAPPQEVGGGAEGRRPRQGGQGVADVEPVLPTDGGR